MSIVFIDLTKDELRTALEQFIAALTEIEEAVGNRDLYTAQLADLPEHRQQLQAERETLEQSPPTTFAEVTGACASGTVRSYRRPKRSSMAY